MESKDVLDLLLMTQYFDTLKARVFRGVLPRPQDSDAAAAYASLGACLGSPVGGLSADARGLAPFGTTTGGWEQLEEQHDLHPARAGGGRGRRAAGPHGDDAGDGGGRLAAGAGAALVDEAGVRRRRRRGGI